MKKHKMKDWTDWKFREKMLFTLGMLFIYRIGVAIPLPFVNPNVFDDALSQGAASGLISAMSMVGGSLTQLGFLSLGVMPYITASIVFQLMKVVIPKVKEMTENPIDQKKITQWTRYLTVLLALIQGAGIILGAPALMGVQVFTSDASSAKIIALFTMTVGAVVTMRIGEEITMRGITNGASLVIFTSILSSIPALANSAFVAKGVVGALGFAAILGLVLAVVSFVEKSEYKVPVVYAKSSMRNLSNRSNLPIKVAIAGVLPVIFAAAFISIPGILSEFTKASWIMALSRWLTHGSLFYVVLYTLLIIMMTYFSIQLVFDVKMISKEINSQGGFVAGKRPGRETEEFIAFIARKMAGIDSWYLVVISMVSLFLFPLVGVPEGAFGATSIIILCTVVVTLLQTIDVETATKRLSNATLFPVSKPKDRS